MPAFRFLTRSGSDRTPVSRTRFFPVFFFWPWCQWPYHGLTERFFIPFLTWDVSDHTMDPVCETGVRSLMSQSKISFKKPGLTDRGMTTDALVKNDFKKMKKPGLWDPCVATGGPGQKLVRKKKTRSVKQWYGLWLVNKHVLFSFKGCPHQDTNAIRHVGSRRMWTNAKKLLVQHLPHKQTSKRSPQRCQVIMRKIRVHVWKAIRRRLKNP